MYRNLKAEKARNNVTNEKIATCLGVRKATISDKLNGRSRFFFDECLKIKQEFFPELPLEYLFDNSDQ